MIAEELAPIYITNNVIPNFFSNPLTPPQELTVRCKDGMSLESLTSAVPEALELTIKCLEGNAFSVPTEWPKCTPSEEKIMKLLFAKGGTIATITKGAKYSFSTQGSLTQLSVKYSEVEKTTVATIRIPVGDLLADFCILQDNIYSLYRYI